MILLFDMTCNLFADYIFTYLVICNKNFNLFHFIKFKYSLKYLKIYYHTFTQSKINYTIKNDST
jgi:hypothetical protein